MDKKENHQITEHEKGFTRKTRKKSFKNRLKQWGFWKVFLVTAFIVMFLVILGSTMIRFFPGTAKVSDSLGTSNEAVSKSDQALPGESSSSVADSNFQFDVTKIIYSGNISLYVDDFQSTFEKIAAYTLAQEGFVQNASSSTTEINQNNVPNSGYLTIRVPAAKFTEAMKEIQSYGTPISSSINSTNISQQYQDVQGQLDNLKIEEARLLDYLNQAENTSDLLLIETELNRVRTEIDNRTTMIKNWDNEINYSTIIVSLSEKAIGTSTVESPFSGLVQKITQGFIASINIILTGLAMLIVLMVRLIPFAAVLGVAYLIYRQIKKNKN